MTCDNGGPAFQVPEGTHYWQESMTLRDYFAAKAMQVELAIQSEDRGHHEKLNAMAAFSYRVADAMLNERMK